MASSRSIAESLLCHDHGLNMFFRLFQPHCTPLIPSWLPYIRQFLEWTIAEDSNRTTEMNVVMIEMIVTIVTAVMVVMDAMTGIIAKDVIIVMEEITAPDVKTVLMNETTAIAVMTVITVTARTKTVTVNGTKVDEVAIVSLNRKCDSRILSLRINTAAEPYQKAKLAK